MNLKEVLSANGTIQCADAQDQKRVVALLRENCVHGFHGRNIDLNGLYIALNGRDMTYLTLNSKATNPLVISSEIDFSNNVSI